VRRLPRVRRRHIGHERGKDLAIFGSSIRASTLAAHELIDEYRFFVVPVLLGRGTRLLDGLSERLNLTLHGTRVTGFGVVAHFSTPTAAGA
jgi:dihydrofolate reductase